MAAPIVFMAGGGRRRVQEEQEKEAEIPPLAQLLLSFANRVSATCEKQAKLRAASVAEGGETAQPLGSQPVLE